MWSLDRELEEDAENDFEIAEILKDTNGDPELINKKVHFSIFAVHQPNVNYFLLAQPARWTNAKRMQIY